MRIGGLEVSDLLYDFVSTELLPGSAVDPDVFWSGLQSLLADLGPRNEELLARRDALQDQIDNWHRDNRYDRNIGTAAPSHEINAGLGVIFDSMDEAQRYASEDMLSELEPELSILRPGIPTVNAEASAYLCHLMSNSYVG